jgi:predicted phosphodiesterase
MREEHAAMKVLIVSDIHANLEALQAVLAESHDALWVLGDLVNYGPNPSEVVELVRSRASLVVQGNHDYAIGSSVGQPKHGAPMACYALWDDGRLMLQSCRYPVEETVKKILSLPVPMEIRRQLAAVLLSGFPPGRGEQLAI